MQYLTVQQQQQQQQQHNNNNNNNNNIFWNASLPGQDQLQTKLN
jgi:hypothetical protein